MAKTQNTSTEIIEEKFILTYSFSGFGKDKPQDVKVKTIISANTRKMLQSKISNLVIEETIKQPSPKKLIDETKSNGKKVKVIRYYTGPTLVAKKADVEEDFVYDISSANDSVKKVLQDALLAYPDENFNECFILPEEHVSGRVNIAMRGEARPKDIAGQIDNFVKEKIRTKITALDKERRETELRDATARAREEASREAKLREDFSTPKEIVEHVFSIENFSSSYVGLFLNQLFGDEENVHLFEYFVETIFSPHDTELKVSLKRDNKGKITGFNINGYIGNDGSIPNFEINLIKACFERIAGEHGTGNDNFDPQKIDLADIRKKILTISSKIGKQLENQQIYSIGHAPKDGFYVEHHSHLGSLSLHKMIVSLFHNAQQKMALRAFTKYFGENVTVTIDEKNADEKAFSIELPFIDGKANTRLRDIILATFATIAKEKLKADQLNKGGLSLDESKITRLIKHAEALYDNNSDAVSAQYIGFDFQLAVDPNTARAKESLEAARKAGETIISQKLETTRGSKYSIPAIDKEGNITFSKAPTPETRHVKPTKNQHVLLELMRTCDFVICDGEAGSGKTLFACYRAAELYDKGYVSQIVISAPNVDVGEAMGFLPGTDYEKMYPYISQILDKFHYIFGDGNKAQGKLIVDKMVETNQIMVLPFNTMRGYDAVNVAGVFDECQNMSWHELTTLTTRLGLGGTKFFLVGDSRQSDRKTEKNAWPLFIEKMDTPVLHKEGLGACTLEAVDVKRHPLVRKIAELKLLARPPELDKR